MNTIDEERRSMKKTDVSTYVVKQKRKHLRLQKKKKTKYFSFTKEKEDALSATTKAAAHVKKERDFDSDESIIESLKEDL